MRKRVARALIFLVVAIAAAVLAYALPKIGRLPWVKLSFNMATQLLCVSAGVLVTELTGGGIIGACIGLATFAVASHLVVAIPIAASSGMAYRRVLVTIG